jgi:hypothetical protein
MGNYRYPNILIEFITGQLNNWIFISKGDEKGYWINWICSYKKEFKYKLQGVEAVELLTELQTFLNT